MLYGYSTFLPTIKGLGTWTIAQTQTLTVPCYALSAITYLTTAKISDRTQLRGLCTVIWCAVSVVGYGILMANVSSGVHYFACFLVAGGLDVAVGIPLAWLPSSEFSGLLVLNSCLFAVSHLSLGWAEEREKGMRGSPSLTCRDQPRHGKRVTASGLQLTAGNAAGIMAYVSCSSLCPEWRPGA